ncbi:hypothetical protein AC578_9656 [Pseudocercospora eumusae]|uniref:Glycoside hydrolase family 92 protein n=1 Tax=Pseudocercospora eumusae TaxID=321146 RepID=A0A139GVQ8_9PEZI|nr:hypothetical protein AC578_9656 [Pseudocercospora eumusae]
MRARLSVFLAAFQLAAAAADFEPLQYVDQLIGSSGGGNVFSGASLPYGMAKAVADTNSGSNQGGFTTDGANITGFSGMHDSGTGGAPSLGLFPLFAYSSCTNDTVNGCHFPKRTRATPYKPESLRATPGYFELELVTGVKAQMTTAFHTALFKFSFPSDGSGSPVVFIDLSDLSNSRQDNASISVEDNGRVTGNARFQPSFGQEKYVAYFCADFQGSIRDSGIYADSRGSTSVKDLKIPRSINGYPLPGGAFLRFKDKNPVTVRMAYSFVSSEQACRLAETEIANFDLEGTKQAAAAAWEEKMSTIVVETRGVNSSALTNFYSGVYRTFHNPQNYTGVQSVVSPSTIYFDSFYCIWDHFRSQFPFLTIVDPTAMEQMIQGLLTLYDVQGWLPDCHMSLSKGYTQGGSNADVVIADAYLKLKSKSIDWKKAYQAVVKDAEEEPYDWCCQGRGGLDSWKALNYIPVSDFDYKGFGTLTRSISRTLEYSYNDFCIAQIAAGEGNQADAEKYQQVSGNWINLFKQDQTSNLFNSSTSTGFTGFFQPRHQNQTWGFQDPLYCSNIDNSPSRSCSLQDNAGETYESSIWEYSFYVPHDMAKLITALGGPETFVKRLDYLHDQKITYIGNEPSFLTVYQYHYAGRPALSAKRAHFYVPAFFSPTNDGLPGNDDSGTMGAFLAFTMMGLFPNPGQDVYFIIPPFFESVNITHPITKKTATIRNINFDPSYSSVYIQSATLDGKPYTRNWIDHSFFTEGKELLLTLGRNESAWGTKIEDLPPSLSQYKF